MKAHLIKSSEVSQELFTNVVDLLQAINGPIQFSYCKQSVVDFSIDDSDMEEKGQVPKKEGVYLSWGEIFDECAEYRKVNKIKNDEYVILLTHYPNELNWFSSLNPHNPYNGFVHTDDWKQFIDCPSEFPIAYEVLTNMLHKHIFYGPAPVATPPHEVPRGCISDFCGNKREVSLKLRTADICEDCMQALRSKLPNKEITHALEILELLRERMLTAQRIMRNTQPSRLYITKGHEIFLPDFEDLEIKLRPLEKVVFLLFLKYPDGILLSELWRFRDEMVILYRKILNDDIVIARAEERMDHMSNFLNNSVSEKISRIKRVFEDALGDILAKHYYIKGATSQPKKISLDRALVSWGK